MFARTLACLLLCLVSFAALLPVHQAQARERAPLVQQDIRLAQLPVEARETLQRIRSGASMPYAKDGTVFGNREGLLPRRPRGYYTEYTVPTPGSRDRGARRIIAGGDPGRSGEYYYTSDHYRSFQQIRE
ncbi:MAG TPA: ribonuclease domain-containing protein [Burkholderiaceae bacterium]|nr:ribonuclease domain-containing protein [Burkholderiaceae bacterium]